MRLRRPRHLDNRWLACGDIVRVLPEVPPDARLPGTEPPLSLAEWFGSEAPVSMEIGCGKGQFVCELARRYPGENFVAVENNQGVLLAAAEQARELNLPNVRFLLVGAQYLHRHIPPQSLSRIYLNFSCPFPKKGYAGRRLTNPTLVAAYRTFLIPGGAVWQKTDDRDFFEYSIEQWQAAGFTLQNVCTDLHHSHFPDNIETEYEQKWVALGKPICRLEAVLAGQATPRTK